MNLSLQLSEVYAPLPLLITGSKSESNRLLLLQALYPKITLENTSNSEDSEVMLSALKTDLASRTQSREIDVHHAGTAMRFLTAYFAIQENQEVVLTGSSRMKERPIAILVEALQELGADIRYIEKKGFPPLHIKGRKLSRSAVTLRANVSSQFISALLLIAPKLENGLELTLEGERTSVPYIQMTLDLLSQIGVKTSFGTNKIIVRPRAVGVQTTTIKVESDWSSASYFYSILAMSKVGTQITLSSFKQSSLQGDSAVVEIYKNFGVETTFEANSITLRKTNLQSKTYNALLNNTPDLAQTIAVTCFGLGLDCHLSGLHTLKIKETDRLVALQNELRKLGAQVSINEDSITITKSNIITANQHIRTYNDHRMAMAFAPLALKVPLVIEDVEVVSKSYPDFWVDLKKIGFNISQI